MRQGIPASWRSTSASHVVVGSALGGLAGALFGREGCGWLLTAVVAVLAGRLARPGTTPRASALLLGSFAALLCIGALLQTVLALPAAWRLLAWLPLAWLVLAHTAGASLAGWLAFSWPATAALRLMVVLPSCWTALEVLLGAGDAAMPWLRLGEAHASGGPLAGALPYGGGLLAGWLTWSVAGGLGAAWCAGRERARWLPAAAAGGLLVLVAASGQVEWTRKAGTMRLALLQPGTELSAPGEASAARRLAWYAQRLADSAADLAITPQLALPRLPEALPAGYLARIDRTLAASGTDALIGLPLAHHGRPSYFNGVVALGASAPQTYRKHRLFPFGEFLPLPAGPAAALQSFLPARLLETVRAPQADAPLRAGGHRIALALCWEAAFADTFRAPAATAGLLVAMSGDGTLASPSLARQWRQVAQARALELQKPLARTSDVDGTFVIDHTGRVVAALPERVDGVLQHTVPMRAGLTPYARWGDSAVLPGLAVALCIAALSRPRRPLSATVPVSDSDGRLRSHAATGQVVPLAAILLVIVAAMFYLMVNAGLAVQEKIRVTNAADAAAYSAAVVEARALNHDAYLNRAIVANEMAIAQMVSFASWIRYFATASDEFATNAADLNAFLLPNPQVARLDVAFGGVEALTAYLGGVRASDVAESFIDVIGPLVAAHDMAAHAAALSQQAVHADLAAGRRQQQVARQVAEQMDPTLQAEVLAASHGFDAFTHPYAREAAGSDERGRLADVTLRSRDAFTRERNWTSSSFDIPLVRRDPALKKRGGTDLVGFDEWRAVDTLELHGRRWGCGKFGLSWCDDIRRPIGWGAVAVRAEGTADARGWHGNAYGENPTTAERADGALRALATATFHGLPDTRDIADTDAAHTTITGLTVRVSKPLAGAAPSAETERAQPSGRLALFGRPPVPVDIAALSRAEVFFDRIAARSDGKVELGSLYNPYWRVRLVAPTADDRAEAVAHQGGVELP